MKPLLALTLLFCLSLPAEAARIFTEVNGSDDTDDARLIEAVAGYQQSLADSRGMVLELAGGDRTYTEGNERESFSVGRVQLQKKERFWQLQLRSNFLNGENWSPVLPAVSLSARCSDSWYVEVAGEREVVDSLQAVRNKTVLDSYTVSADYRLSDSWTLVGAALYQQFSDSNRKRGGIGRVIFTPRTWSGFHLQLKARQLEADSDSPDYFSPRRLTDAFLLLGYATPLADDNFVFKVLAGPGRQQIEPFGAPEQTKTVYLAELNLRGWIQESWNLTTKLVCSSANETSSSYRYCYGQLSLGYEF